MREKDLFERLAAAEAALPSLLEDDGWQSLRIDYERPFVERLWRPWGDGRLSLHAIHPCAPEQALYHPHPWPSAMRLKERGYRMRVGFGPGLVPPPVATELVLPPETVYAMADIDGWHAVIPEGGIAYTVMVTGMPWGRAAPKRVPPLNPLSPERIDELLRVFRGYYPQR